MIQSLSHIQRSRRLSQDFDDYLERTSRSSIHSSSSDLISPHYDYAHQHEAKLLAYHNATIHYNYSTHANYNGDSKDMMHNAHSGPNQAQMETHTIANKTTDTSTNQRMFIGQNKLIGNLNKMKAVNLDEIQTESFMELMDEMSSDSDLSDDEKIQYKKESKPNKQQQIYIQQHSDHPQLIHQLPKVPKPRVLNLNVHRQNNNYRQNNPMFLYHNNGRHERADSNESMVSSSMNSSVCTPHYRDNSGSKSQIFFQKQLPSIMNAKSMLSSMSQGGAISQQTDQSNMSNITYQSMRSGPTTATTHINIKIFDNSTECTSEIWMNIKLTDTSDDVIASVIHQYRSSKSGIIGSKVTDYELRYYDIDDEIIDEDFPPLGRNENVASKGIDAVAMNFIGSCSDHTSHYDQDIIPDIDWDYKEYEVTDEYSHNKNVCILGIGYDRIHIMLKKSNIHHKNSNINKTGSLMPHFTYVFNLPNSKPTNLYNHRWIDGRILTRQKNTRIKLHQSEEKQKELNQLNENRNRSISTTFNNYQNTQLQNAQNNANFPKLGLMMQSSIPTNNVLNQIQALRLTPLRSGLLLDDYEEKEKEKDKKKIEQKKRRKSSVWSFNLFGLLNKSKTKAKTKSNKANNDNIVHIKSKIKSRMEDDNQDIPSLDWEGESVINYESWNTYNKDGKYFDKELTAHYRSMSGSVTSFRSNSYGKRSSILSNISIDNDEFTPLTIELCQKISVLKRDNTVFEINFLLDLSSKTPSINSLTFTTPPNVRINHNRSASKQYWGPRSKRKSKDNSYESMGSKQNTVRTALSHTRSTSRTVSQQSSTRSLSMLGDNPNQNIANKQHGFQPYQADNIEIWTDISHSHSPSEKSINSDSSMEFMDCGDYKPSNYKQHWDPKQIIPTLQKVSNAPNNLVKHPNSLVKQLVNKTQFVIFGNDKYLTHTCRYTAKSPEDCCEIVRKIQHLMLLENTAMDNNVKK